MTNEEKAYWLALYDKRIYYRVQEMSRYIYEHQREDLYQVAKLSVCMALDTYDPSLGFQPWSYAKKKMEWDIIRYMQEKIPLVRVYYGEKKTHLCPEFMFENLVEPTNELKDRIEADYKAWLLEELKRRADEIPHPKQRENTLALLNGTFKGSRQMRSLTVKHLRKLVKVWGLHYEF